MPVNKVHDYFTSCLPYPQRGPEVTIPMTGNAPVTMKKNSGEPDLYGNLEMVVGMTPENNKAGALTYTTNAVTNKKQFEYSGTDITSGEVGAGGWVYADLSNVTATTINELRNAIAVQQYYEAMARGGSRYREQLQALWDVTISDKTVQIPEYLGGGRYHVNMNQIVQTSGQQSATDTPIGETGALTPEETPITDITAFPQNIHEYHRMMATAQAKAMELTKLQEMAKAEPEAKLETETEAKEETK